MGRPFSQGNQTCSGILYDARGHHKIRAYVQQYTIFRITRPSGRQDSWEVSRPLFYGPDGTPPVVLCRAPERATGQAGRRMVCGGAPLTRHTRHSRPVASDSRGGT